MCKTGHLKSRASQDEAERVEARGEGGGLLSCNQIFIAREAATGTADKGHTLAPRLSRSSSLSS